MKEYDVAIIGAGPGGYSAALELSKYRKKIICIDNGNLLGGVCLNSGCIPSKTLLNATYKYSQIKRERLDSFFLIPEINFSLEGAMKRKRFIIESLAEHMVETFALEGIEYVRGIASFISPNELQILKNGDSNQVEIIQAKNIIISTGSTPRIPSNIILDEISIVSSTGLMEINKIPNKLLILGGGVIGIEFASMFSRIGTEVIIVDHGPRILAALDEDLSNFCQNILIKRNNIKILKNSSFVSLEKYYINNEQKISVIVSSNDKEQTIDNIDIVLVAMGRSPNIEALSIPNIGIKTTNQGSIKVDEFLRTNISNIYAIGDVICGPMLAHKASVEGIAVAEIISGQERKVNYRAIPAVIYTQPEIATVGYSEKELRNSSIEYEVAKYSLNYNSRAMIEGEREGFVKILFSPSTRIILGAVVVNHNATEVIGELILAIENQNTIDILFKIVHPYPCINEIIHNACNRYIKFYTNT